MFTDLDEELELLSARSIFTDPYELAAAPRLRLTKGNYTCRVCQGDLTRARKARALCSKFCRAEVRKERYRATYLLKKKNWPSRKLKPFKNLAVSNCIVCLTDLKPTNRPKKYCGVNCAMRAHRRKNAETLSTQ